MSDKALIALDAYRENYAPMKKDKPKAKKIYCQDCWYYRIDAFGNHSCNHPDLGNVPTRGTPVSRPSSYRNDVYCDIQNRNNDCQHLTSWYQAAWRWFITH